MGIEAIGQTAWAIMTALLAKDKSAMGQTLSKYPHIPLDAPQSETVRDLFQTAYKWANQAPNEIPYIFAAIYAPAGFPDTEYFSRTPACSLAKWENMPTHRGRVLRHIQSHIPAHTKLQMPEAGYCPH